MKTLTYLFSVFLFTILLISCGQTDKNETLSVRSIAWLKVEENNFTQVRHLAGVLQSVDSAPLSFQVSGKVEDVTVNLGDQVVTGQLLAKLQPSNYQLALQSAEGELRKAKASYSDKHAEFLRFEQLKRQQLVSLSAFDNVKSQYEAAESSVEVATTQLDIAKKNLADATLYAPYDGYISKRLIEPSQQVSVGQTAFEIEASHGLEVSVLVPETLIQQIKQGMECKITSQLLPNQELTAKVSEVANNAQDANAFPVVLTLNQQDESLRAGMSVEVEFSFNGKGRTGYRGTAVKVPVSALLPDKQQTTYVFIYNPQTSKLTKTKVQTENIINNQVLISSGLSAGDIIATAGVNFLQDGQEVNLLETNIQIFN